MYNNVTGEYEDTDLSNPVYEEPQEPVSLADLSHEVSTSNATINATIENTYVNVDRAAYENVGKKENMYEGLDTREMEMRSNKDKVYQGLK